MLVLLLLVVYSLDSIKHPVVCVFCLVVQLHAPRLELCRLFVDRLLGLLSRVYTLLELFLLLLVVCGTLLSVIDVPECDVDFQLFEAVAHLEVFLSFFTLFFKIADTSFYLRNYVVYAVKVLSGMLKLVLRLGLPRLVRDDPCGLLEYRAPRLRLVAHDVGDLTLADDRVAVHANACVHDELTDVLQAALIVVDQVFAVAVPVHAPRYRDFAVVDLQDPCRVVDNERDLSHTFGAAGFSTVEDDLLHTAASQRFRALFAEHPAESVAHVRLAAPVRADDTRHAFMEIYDHGVRERLEPLHFQSFKIHLTSHIVCA